MSNREEVIAKNAKKRKARRKRRITGFLVFLFTMLLLIFAILSVTVLFPVKRVIVKNESIYTKKEIVSASGITADSNIILLSKSDVISKISKNLAYSGEISVEKVFPDTVRLHVKTAVPTYYVINDGSYCVLDSNFKFIETAEEPPADCMLIKSNTKWSIELGEVFKLKEEEDALLSELLKLTGEKGLGVTGIDISDEIDIKFIVDSRIIVQLGTSVDLQHKIGHFAASYEKMSEKASGLANLKAWTSSNTKSTFRDVKIDTFNFCELVTN